MQRKRRTSPFSDFGYFAACARRTDIVRKRDFIRREAEGKPAIQAVCSDFEIANSHSANKIAFGCEHANDRSWHIATHPNSGGQ
jgi:hypothetical protein